MKRPEHSVLCNKCRTDAVLIGRDLVCDCDVAKARSRFSPETAESLARAVSLTRGYATVCDRCNSNTAYRLVPCYAGCSHAQCFGCAEQTAAERISERISAPHRVVSEDKFFDLLDRLQ